MLAAISCNKLRQDAHYLATVLTTEPVPERVKILSSKDAGNIILSLLEILEQIENYSGIKFK